MTEQVPQNERLKHALCYVPIVAFIFFFTESKKTEELMTHIKYGGAIFVVYIIANIFLSWAIGGILFLMYVGICGFLWYKAYVWEDVEIDYIDKAEDKIKKSFNDRKD